MAFVQKWDSVQQGWPDSGITTGTIVPAGQAAGSLLVFVVDQRTGASTITETSGNGWIDSGLYGTSSLLGSKVFYKLATGDSGTDTATFSSDTSVRSYGSVSEFSEIKSPLNLEDAVVGVIAAGDVGVDYPNATATTSSGTAVVTANANIWNTALPYTFQNAIAHFSRNGGSNSRPGHTLGSFDYASSGAVTDTATSAATLNSQTGFILLFEKSGGVTPEPPTEVNKSYTHASDASLSFQLELSSTHNYSHQSAVSLASEVTREIAISYGHAANTTLNISSSGKYTGNYSHISDAELSEKYIQLASKSYGHSAVVSLQKHIFKDNIQYTHVVDTSLTVSPSVSYSFSYTHVVSVSLSTIFIPKPEPSDANGVGLRIASHISIGL